MLRPLLLLLATALPAEARDPPARVADIDALVDQQLARNGDTPAAIVDDATFVRRAYLDIVGRIPTAAEARAFLDDRDNAKRARLVDGLLDAPGYESHIFHWWADLLRVKSDLEQRLSGEPFAHWIKESIHTNVPFDEMVTAMITAQGPAHARGNGATGYLMRDRGMTEDNMSNTARLFLGTRIECAQCHNHPYADWTQRQYYELVAFTGGIDYKLKFDDSAETMHFVDLRERSIDEHGAQAKAAFRRAFRSLGAGIEGSGSGAVKLPDDYAYEDAEPGSYVTAHTLSGDMITSTPTFGGNRKRRARTVEGSTLKRKPLEQGTRAVFAEWLTSADNELFVRVITNRMWKRVMGRGLIEPVDDFGEATIAAAPELMLALEALMVAVDFDLREFQRVLYHTQTYQRSASRGEATFPGAPQLRRLSATQIWDSWMTLVVPDLDDRIADPAAAADEVYEQYDALLTADAQTLEATVRRQLLRRTDRNAYDALIAEEKATKRDRKREARKLVKDLKKARRKGREDDAAQAQAALLALGFDTDDRQARNENAWRDEGLVRASDLPSPAPPDHLLQTFGQSDRDLPEGSHVDPTVPQALALMNGVVDTWLADDALDPYVITVLEESDDVLDDAFLSVLTRHPTAAERSIWQRDLQRDPERVRLDLLWTLVNSHEFLFLL